MMAEDENFRALVQKHGGWIEVSDGGAVAHFHTEHDQEQFAAERSRFILESTGQGHLLNGIKPRGES